MVGNVYDWNDGKFDRSSKILFVAPGVIIYAQRSSPNSRPRSRISGDDAANTKDGLHDHFVTCTGVKVSLSERQRWGVVCHGEMCELNL